VEYGECGQGGSPVTYEDVLYEAEGGIARITINRPNVRNAVRPKTYEELTHAMSRAADDPTIGVVVLSGAGDKAFCSGGDVRDQSRRVPQVGRTHMRRLFALSTVMRTMDKPIVAKVRGFCVGGGNEINLFCDLTVASEDSKFGQTGPRVGSIPIWGACQLLARFVGERKAREMVYLCRQYSAREALEMGLINQVCPAEDLDRVVDEICNDILDKSPQSIRIAKLSLNAGSDRDFYAAFFPNAELLASIYGNEENMEGITAFLEKRKPDFRRFRRQA
jgi:naphthoate synthase/2-ketocyclohexanecarboxyl-CoA hydrolase